jgi:hypothetical protein
MAAHDSGARATEVLEAWSHRGALERGVK